MLDLLITGRLISAPRLRAGPSGRPYATCLIRVPTDDAGVLVSAIAFQEQAEPLARLHVGDALAAIGPGKLTTWTNQQGEEQHGLGITIHRLMSVYQSRELRRNFAGRGRGVDWTDLFEDPLPEFGQGEGDEEAV